MSESRDYLNNLFNNCRPKFMLDANGKIYEIVHYPSVGASTVALNIGLDYIIKVLLDEDLPESIPDTGIQNLTELIVETSADS